MPTSSKKRHLPTNLRCDACGKLLVIDPSSKGRIARFCSPNCRAAYHKGKRPVAENTLSLDDLLDTLAELAEGTHSFDKELAVIRNILQKHFRRK